MTTPSINPTPDLQDSLALITWWPDIFKYGRPTITKCIDGYFVLRPPRQGAVSMLHEDDLPPHIVAILTRRASPPAVLG